MPTVIIAVMTVATSLPVTLKLLSPHFASALLCSSDMSSPLRDGEAARDPHLVASCPSKRARVIHVAGGHRGGNDPHLSSAGLDESGRAVKGVQAHVPQPHRARLIARRSVRQRELPDPPCGRRAGAA